MAILHLGLNNNISFDILALGGALVTPFISFAFHQDSIIYNVLKDKNIYFLFDDDVATGVIKKYVISTTIYKISPFCFHPIVIILRNLFQLKTYMIHNIIIKMILMNYNANQAIKGVVM
jgi:hypothetical protein